MTTLLEKLLAADSEAKHEWIRNEVEELVAESSLEEVREVIAHAPTFAEAGCSRGEASALLIGEGGKKYPELAEEALKGLEHLSKHISLDVKMCVVDAASILNTDEAKELVVQMAKDEPLLERRVKFTLLLWDEDFDDDED